MLLSKDPKYQYSMQLSLWVEDPLVLTSMLEPFMYAYPHALVRVNNRQKYAVFTKGDASERTRYKLEVILGCEVYTLKECDKLVLEIRKLPFSD